MLPADHKDPTKGWDRLQIYRQRYEIDHLLGQVDSLERSLKRRHMRQAAARRRIEGLEELLTAARAELDSVTTEIEGSLATGALLIEEILDRVREENDERWSPVPLRGFRVWRVHDGAMRGNQISWQEPSMTGRCLRSIPGDDIPHSTRRCGPPACGIYAVKSLDWFPAEMAACDPADMAVGVVALAGKVVEHELGYRAQRAKVIALAINHSGTRLVTGRATEIDALFRDPGDGVDRLMRERSSSPSETRDFLEAVQQEDAWTSETRSGS